MVDTPRTASTCLTSISAHRPLPRDVNISLLFLVFMPYLRAKAQDYFEFLGSTLSADELQHFTSPTLPAGIPQLGNIFRRAYPWLSLLFEGWLLSYNLRYMVGSTPFYRPWLAWMKIDVERAIATEHSVSSKGTNQYMRRPASLKRMAMLGPRMILESFKYVLPLAIMCIKFMEWWYSPSSPARALASAPTALPIQSPRMLLPRPQGVQVDPRSYALCPICKRSINNATAMPSGYVFCFRCAYNEVDLRGRCPVTLISVHISQLRKVLM